MFLKGFGYDLCEKDATAGSNHLDNFEKDATAGSNHLNNFEKDATAGSNPIRSKHPILDFIFHPI